MTPPPPAAGGRRPARRAAPPAAAAGPTSEKLADGVFRINGAYNALAVEFADHIVLFEPGPQNEARALAIIAETKRVIPNKPIRYGVISHHHFDHTSGLPAVVAEGITIVTHEINKAFLERALAAPRTLAPDAMSKSGKKPVIEGFAGDKRVFQDATRTVRDPRDQGPAARRRRCWSATCRRRRSSSTPTCSTCRRRTTRCPIRRSSARWCSSANIERLKLEPERIMSVHSLNPDRLTTVADIRKSLGQ